MAEKMNVTWGKVRSTAEVLSTLTPEQREGVQAVRNDVKEVMRDVTDAILPPSAGHCYLMEQAGWVWNFETGRYE